MRSLPPIARILIALEAFLAIGAAAGAWALIADRNGGDNVDMTLLEGTPFDSYLFPGLALLVLNCLFPLAVMAMAVTRKPLAGPGHVAAGVVLMAWIGAQVGFIGYASLLQPFFFLYGAAMAALGAVAMGYRLPVPGLGRASRAATRR
ncbi:MAG: hypothetical protein IPG47_14330 [Thermoflexaceae bacterium]|nr:hypothetical protein [Thermoflexaceae bacterium]